MFKLLKPETIEILGETMHMELQQQNQGNGGI